MTLKSVLAKVNAPAVSEKRSKKRKSKRTLRKSGMKKMISSLPSVKRRPGSPSLSQRATRSSWKGKPRDVSNAHISATSVRKYVQTEPM